MENHNHYAPILEFKDIDHCISKGRLSKKLTEKMLDNKNSRIKDLEQKLAKAVDVLKLISATDITDKEPDFLWLQKWRNTRKEYAGKVLDEILKELEG